jgi:two-component system response regulator (stage 0 sporulation protein F)
MGEIGCRVILAKDGFEAVEAVKKHRPDLVFLDVRMPLKSGLRALGEIKSISPETKVVIMTAYISNEVVSEAMEKGALFCKSKPLDIEEIKVFLEKSFEEFFEKKG